MKTLKDFKDDIHKCSKCGLCQAVCPLYKITGNDCTVSRGQFIMLQGLLEGKYGMTKKLNNYLDLCLKCNACSKFCPSGIDVVDIIAAAKHEYYKEHSFEKFVSFIFKIIFFKLGLNFIKLFHPNKKSKTFEKKVLYFGGCGSKYKGDNSVIDIMNSLKIEVINPNFNCCGFPFFVRGDLDNFKFYISEYVKILKKYDIKDVLVSCASCEKALKSYIRHCDNEEDKTFLSSIKVKNIYEYIRENHCKLKLKQAAKVTFHKPCNINNWDDILWILNNTENLEYVEMNDFDKCCGFNGISKFRQFPVLKNIYREKHDNILRSGAKIVLTACLGCAETLKLYSFGKYKVYDFAEFLAKKIY